MTPEQLKLARHALGLPNQKRRSYRNRFTAPHGTTNHHEWMQMCAAGMAYHEGAPHLCGQHTKFWLTERGAMTALAEGETLCPEDFPA